MIRVPMCFFSAAAMIGVTTRVAMVIAAPAVVAGPEAGMAEGDMAEGDLAAAVAIARRATDETNTNF